MNGFRKGFWLISLNYLFILLKNWGCFTDIWSTIFDWLTHTLHSPYLIFLNSLRKLVFRKNNHLNFATCNIKHLVNILIKYHCPHFLKSVKNTLFVVSFYIYKNTLLCNVYIILHDSVVLALPEMNIRFPRLPPAMWLSILTETPLVVPRRYSLALPT